MKVLSWVKQLFKYFVWKITIINWEWWTATHVQVSSSTLIVDCMKYITSWEWEGGRESERESERENNKMRRLCSEGMWPHRSISHRQLYLVFGARDWIKFCIQFYIQYLCSTLYSSLIPVSTHKLTLKSLRHSHLCESRVANALLQVLSLLQILSLLQVLSLINYFTSITKTAVSWMEWSEILIFMSCDSFHE